MAEPTVWRPVVGYEGLYEVSSDGQVRSLDRLVRGRNGCLRLTRGRVLVPTAHENGHLRITLARSGTRRIGQIHRLVLEAFAGPCPPGSEACHENGNPADNRVENLRWDTHSGNMLDRRRHGTDHQLNKTHCPKGHPLDAGNLRPDALEDGRRGCATCKRAGATARRREIAAAVNATGLTWREYFATYGQSLAAARAITSTRGPGQTIPH